MACERDLEKDYRLRRCGWGFHLGLVGDVGPQAPNPNPGPFNAEA